MLPGWGWGGWRDIIRERRIMFFTFCALSRIIWQGGGCYCISCSLSSLLFRLVRRLNEFTSLLGLITIKDGQRCSTSKDKRSLFTSLRNQKNHKHFVPFSKKADLVTSGPAVDRRVEQSKEVSFERGIIELERFELSLRNVLISF